MERLAACKKYMRIDFVDDDEIVCALLDTADGYLTGAGISRAVSPAMYDTIAYVMTLEMYDGRGATDPQQAASAPLVQRMLTQLKLRCAYEEVPDDGNSG